MAYAAAQKVADQLSGIESGKKAHSVGAETEDIPDIRFYIGVGTFGTAEVPGLVAWQGFNNGVGTWFVSDPPPKELFYVADTVVFADFTLIGPAPESVTIGGTVTGLVTAGLVLQNNGADDLTIDVDGDFEFATPVIVGEPYDVTVFTQPDGQTCIVENGSGLAPDTDVTNVAVSCADLVGGISKVAAEGETLPDGTVLKEIDLDGGVAINISGKVAFGGRDVDNTGAVFTQAGLVAKEDDTLPDGTEVDDILTSGTLNEIKDPGKVAINDFDHVAFHGKIEIEVEDGLFDTEEFDAVFTSDGLKTLVTAREGSELPDLTTVQAIDENGGVAINDFDQVVFHGKVGTTDVVLVGKAPLPPPQSEVSLAEGDESSSE